jgi:hypothetical protein
VNRLKEIVLNSLHTAQDDLETMMIGLFQVALGVWVLTPMESFGPVVYAPAGSFFDQIGEAGFGLLFVIVGLLYVAFAYLDTKRFIKNLYLFSSMMWSFVAVGYWLNLPNGTGVIIYSFFAAWSVYTFINRTMCEINLRNKQKIGNI